MELQAIFSDDRDEALAHYGVLGMRWGVRNEETRRKYNAHKTRQADRKIAKVDAKQEKAARLLSGKANREANHPTVRRYSTAVVKQANKLAVKQAKAGAARYKYIKKGRLEGGTPDEYARKSNQAIKARKSVARSAVVGGVLGGALGGVAGYYIAKNRAKNKEGLEFLNELSKQNLYNSRKTAAEGRRKTLEILDQLDRRQRKIDKAYDRLDQSVSKHGYNNSLSNRRAAKKSPPNNQKSVLQRSFT